MQQLQHQGVGNIAASELTQQGEGPAGQAILWPSVWLKLS